MMDRWDKSHNEHIYRSVYFTTDEKIFYTAVNADMQRKAKRFEN